MEGDGRNEEEDVAIFNRSKKMPRSLVRREKEWEEVINS